MKTVELKKAEKKDYGAIKNIYTEAFPDAERKPFSLLKHSMRCGAAELLKIVCDGELVGMFYLYFYKGYALIDYFAVKPDARGEGIGSRAMKLLLESYSEYKIFLEIEEHSVGELQNRRRLLYERMGFSLNGLKVHLFSVDMEIMTAGCDIGFEDYLGLYSDVAGRFFAKRNVKLR